MGGIRSNPALRKIQEKTQLNKNVKNKSTSCYMVHVFCYPSAIRYEKIQKKTIHSTSGKTKLRANPSSSSPTQALQEGPICPFQAQTRLSPPIKHREVENPCFAM